jgi:hypothetical protein
MLAHTGVVPLHVVATKLPAIEHDCTVVPLVQVLA